MALTAFAKKWIRLVRNNFTMNPGYILHTIRFVVNLVLLNLETSSQFAKHYGDFHRGRDLRDYLLANPGSEGGAIIGDVVYLATSDAIGDGRILLAGDRREVKNTWSTYFSPDKVDTCGIHEMDYFWNFEEPLPPALAERRYGLIISHAMIEHLVDPFQHARDLASLLAPGGYLVLHSVLPGFFYHRVPIDCLRFYPDWFENVARRLKLSVVDKQISIFNITYKMRRD